MSDRYGPWREIEIDGIACLARRDKEGVSYAKWQIVERTTKASLMPPSWPASYNAATLEGAKHLVQREVIDRFGKPEIERRRKLILAEQGKIT